MPVVDHGDGVRVEYEIPREIKDRIPPYFYIALAGELFSIYGWERSKDMFYPRKKQSYTDLASSTAGWVAALRATCRKMEMDWLISYYDTLPWYDSDVFDGILEQEIGRHYINADRSGPNDYYRHILEREEMVGKDIAATEGREGADEV